MILSFTLSMPNVASWDGKWSGQDRLYVKVHSFGRGKSRDAKARKFSTRGISTTASGTVGLPG